MSIRVYLAGPEVFLPDADALFDRKKALCAQYGMVGVCPLDDLPNVPEGGAAPLVWHAIYRRNELHLRNCDALIANLTPFRGISADPGTVFELGFMRALGRPVFGYSMTGTRFTERTARAVGAAGGPSGVDGDGLAIEDFGLQDNLMIDGAIDAAGGVFVVGDHGDANPWRDLSLFENCVRAAARLSNGPASPPADRAPL
jgi:nucleoside 2-deoxyribosyltransferase